MATHEYSQGLPARDPGAAVAVARADHIPPGLGRLRPGHPPEPRHHRDPRRHVAHLPAGGGAHPAAPDGDVAGCIVDVAPPGEVPGGGVAGRHRGGGGRGAVLVRVGGPVGGLLVQPPDADVVRAWLRDLPGLEEIPAVHRRRRRRRWHPVLRGLLLVVICGPPPGERERDRGGRSTRARASTGKMRCQPRCCSMPFCSRSPMVVGAHGEAKTVRASTVLTEVRAFRRGAFHAGGTWRHVVRSVRQRAARLEPEEPATVRRVGELGPGVTVPRQRLDQVAIWAWRWVG